MSGCVERGLEAILERCFEKGNRMSICKGLGKAGGVLFSCLLFFFYFGVFVFFFLEERVKEHGEIINMLIRKN